MAKFNLTPTMFDKVKGNVILVKKDELEKFAEYCKENVSKVEELENRVKELQEENEKLKRELNQKIISQEIGKDSELVKLEKENEELKAKIQELENKYEIMEKTYLAKIKELKSNDCDIKKEIESIIKETLHKEFKKFEEPVGIANFEINI